jgi:hypothetical protein
MVRNEGHTVPMLSVAFSAPSEPLRQLFNLDAVMDTGSEPNLMPGKWLNVFKGVGIGFETMPPLVLSWIRQEQVIRVSKVLHTFICVTLPGNKLRRTPASFYVLEDGDGDDVIVGVDLMR